MGKAADRLKAISKKTWLLVAGILITAVICLAAAVNYSGSRSGTLDGMEWQKTEDGSYELECFRLGVAKGEYTINVFYDSEETLSYRLVDMQRNNGENELGLEIAKGTFPAGKTETFFDFNLSQSTGKIALYLESKDGVSSWGEWSIETRSKFYADFVLIFSCIVAGLLLLWRFRDWEKHSGIIFAVGTALLLTLPFLAGYQQGGDDLYFHMARIRGIAGGLETGQFPVRLNTDFAWGYGFSSSMMYPELFLYIPAVLYMLGVSLIGSYKFLILCINIGTACVGLYSFKRLLRSDRLGLVVTILYLTNPYRLMNIFYRAALGEIIAQIFLPLLLYGIYELIFGNTKKWRITVIAATGIIQCHVLSVEMSLIFVIGAVIVGIPYMLRHGFIERFLGMVKAGAAAVGVNLWFLIPFLDHLGDGSVIQDQAKELQARAVDLYTMFRINMKMESFLDDGGVVREEFISIGAVLLLGSLIYLYYAFIKCSVETRLRQIGAACLCLGALCCYMSTRAFPWRFLQVHVTGLYDILATIQFPWRFLAYASLSLSVTTGIAVMELIREKREAVAAVLAGLTVFMMFSCMDQYASQEIYISSRSEIQSYDRDWFDYYSSEASAVSIIDQGDTVMADSDIAITSYERSGVEFSFAYSGVEEKCTLRLPIYDYGMHEVYLNGEKITPAASVNHQLTVVLTEEEPSGYIEVKYKEPFLYKAGSGVSLIVVAVFAAVGVMRRKRKNGERKDILSDPLL